MSRLAIGTRPWLHWIVVVATVVLLVFAARTVEWSRTWDAISHANPTFIAIAVVANLGSIVVKALRWSLFLHATGVSSVRLAVHASFAGAALNNLLVANGGDAARVLAVARRANVPSAAVLATLALDRVCDLVTYLLIFVTCAFALPLPLELARWRTPALALLLGLAALGLILIAWNRRRERVSTDVDQRAPTVLFRARTFWRRLVATSASIVTRRRLVTALGLALVSWSGQWATFHYAARATSLAATPAISLLALLVVNASFLVRLTPGNVGVFQLLYALAATSAGLDRDHAVAVAFLISVIQYIPVMLIGLPLAPSLVSRREPAIVPPESPTSAGT